ncbi:MAG: adenylate/guanylate cyclase domain-containing protein [Thermodesulfobacteriota bacterium]
MRARIVKGILLGIATGVLGLLAGLAPEWTDLEERLGLEILFRLRGPRSPPSEVVVVGIDRESADTLDLDDDCRKWPRSLHARLTERLAAGGAAVIAFDVFFEDPASEGQDRVFAQAMRKAGNVLLCERLKVEKLPYMGKGGKPGGAIEIARRIPPTLLLGEAAASSVPYPLPKVPARVSRDWTFRTTAGKRCQPTLPVAAFQWHVLPAYPEFLRLIETVFPEQARVLPRSGKEFVRSHGIAGMILALREILGKDPTAERKLLAALDGIPRVPGDEARRRILRSLVRLYGGDDRKLLNFYGPPRTIPTIPYHRLVRNGKNGRAFPETRELAGKAVFVGSSEARRLAQKDGFLTVYTGGDGVDLSGVEIEATSFANLVEDMPVRPLPFLAQFATILLWGIVVGILSFLFRPAVSITAVAGVSVLYLAASVQRFAAEGAWFPVVYPLLVQGPLAVASAVAWSYAELSRERRNFRSAFARYLPAEVVEDMAGNIDGLSVRNRLVSGVCLATDVERYTALSGSMKPEELAGILNRYYEAVFDPVRRHGGTVFNVVADSMLALWLARRDNPAPLKDACRAAIEIAESMRNPRRTPACVALPTRIGLHSGEILLGNIGAGRHFESGPVGDIVNTATRIEGLNKILGTRILASGDVLSLEKVFLVRDMGLFLLAGKSLPVQVCELIACRAAANPAQVECCASFSEGMAHFRRGEWGKSAARFQQALDIRRGDGPSLYFLDLCRRYTHVPPGEDWDGVVRVEGI